MVTADEVRDAVGDDARFAGAGAGEKQQGPFDMGDCFLLLGIETSEKVHSKTSLPWVPVGSHECK